jgi:SAM-dependent methyltransferase
MEDQYREIAEFVDILSHDAWHALGPALADVLRHGDFAGGPVIDIGAGSGLATAVIAQALPNADILAVEPSPALRAVLLAKLVVNSDLVKRVTVVDSDFQHAALPLRFGTVVAMNMIGHLATADRRALWALLAQRLAPQGQAVLNLQGPNRPTHVPESRFAEVAIGRRSYEGWGRAQPCGSDALTWHMRYRTLEDGVMVAERTLESRWQLISEEHLRAELADHGLVLRAVGPPETQTYAINRPPERQ